MNAKVVAGALVASLLASSAHAVVMGRSVVIEPDFPDTPPPVASLGPTVSSMSTTSFGSFTIDLNITGSASAQTITAFENAASYWSDQISGFRSQAAADIFQLNFGSVFEIDVTFADLPGSIIGSAGSSAPTHIGGGFFMSMAGAAEFDTPYLNSQSAQAIENLALHEIAHTMGFSNAFWDNWGVTQATTRAGLGASGIDDYTGAFALAAYNDEFGLSETVIPLEDNGGNGTANSHWDEALFGNYQANGGSVITNCLGEVGFICGNPELMTGVSDTLVGTISNATIASFDDIGFATALNTSSTVVPLPAGGWLLLTGLAAIGLGGRRRTEA